MSNASAQRYTNDHEHIRDELRRLDLRIRLRTATLPLLNAAYPADQVDRAAYISPAEVTWLLTTAAPADSPVDRDVAAIEQALAHLSADIDERVAASRCHGVALRLPRIAELFGLSTFETQALVVCLAPELRAKYDRLYAYLQDDITRKRPSLDLILALVCDSEAQRWTMQATVCGAGPLLRWRLVHTVPDPHSPSGSSALAQFLRLDPRICRFLLGDDRIDADLERAARLCRPPAAAHMVDGAAAAMLGRLIATGMHTAGPTICYLHGPADAGLSALALTVCAEHGLTAVMLDVAELSTFAADDAADLLRSAYRESALQGGVVYLERADTLLAEPLGATARALRRITAEVSGPVLLGGEQPWTAPDLLAGGHFHTIEVPAPDLTRRTAMWRHHLQTHAPKVTAHAEELAARFTLGEDRIEQAIRGAQQHRARRSPGTPPSVEDLAAACRDQADRNLGGLAAKIEPRYAWRDLVLPPAKVTQLQEICDQVSNHHLVYDAWGFGRKLAHGRGLSVLFAGPPGTGKTMAAEVIAREVGLRLLKVDLSAVVSKYIGETEKNLARIFDAAQAAGAILFFDEADALFGRRTEVSDAHDRYANIETSYLLQKMDEYEGLVLLASNLRANLDDAFTRRIRYVVEFPFPATEYRQRIWETHFPAEAPVAADIDFAALARDFEVAGGSIKNIVINAAFLAAADGHRVGMPHILSGTRREFEKLGKLWSHPTPVREVTR